VHEKYHRRVMTGDTSLEVC